MLSRVGRLQVVEIDREIIPVLKKQFADHQGFTVHQADALKFDYSRLKTDAQNLRLIGNLPYNISTPLLFHLISFNHIISDMLFMLQKEVVDRLVAQVGTKEYGRLSVMVACRCQVTRAFNIKPGAFMPPPKVDSSIVHIQPYRDPPIQVGDAAHFEKIVRFAFGKRRKTLRNALKEIISEKDFDEAEINQMLRPEQLSIEQFGRLSITSYKANQNTDRI